MANILKIAPNNQYGNQVANAAAQFRAAFGALEALNGLRAEAINGGQASMKATFGLLSEADAQALNDRWYNLLDATFNPQSGAYNNFTILRDFMNAVIFDV